MQPWEDGLLSFDALDDEFMLNSGAYDTFASGQDMFNQNTTASNWDFTSPTMGQDFDLYSYDNTLDFDASLYVNTPSPSLQSSSLSPTSLQQPPQGFSQSFQQSMDASQQPFAYDVDDQLLGNVDGTASEYSVAVNSWDTGEFDGLEPDRPRNVGREPQEGATILGRQGPQSRAFAAKQQRPQSGDEIDHKPIDPRTDLLLESIASSPETSVLGSIQNSPKSVKTHPRGPTWASDPSQSLATGSLLGSHEHQTVATGLLTPPDLQRSPVLEASGSSFERSPDVSFHHQSARLENADRTVLSPGSGLPSQPSTSSIASFLDSFEDSGKSPTCPLWASIHDPIDQASAMNTSGFQRRRPSAIQRDERLSTMVSSTHVFDALRISTAVLDVARIATHSVLSSTTTPKAARKTRSSGQPAAGISRTHQSTTDCGLCPTAATTVPDNGSINSQQETTRANTNSDATDSKTYVARTNVAVKDDRETRTEHTAAKTHSLSTSTFRLSDTPTVEGAAATRATVPKSAETAGLVPSSVTGSYSLVPYIVVDDTKAPASYLDKLSNIVSRVFMQFSHGFRVGHSHARIQGKSTERGPGRDLEVLMGGLRLC